MPQSNLHIRQKIERMTFIIIMTRTEVPIETPLSRIDQEHRAWSRVKET